MFLEEWFYAGRTLKAAILLTITTFFVIAISFGTPYWLQSIPSDQLPEPKFTNLGLWAVCLNGFHDMRHQYEVKLYGCKHILLEEYDFIRHELQPPFFIATQFFFTLNLMGMLVALAFIIMYLTCINDYYRVSVLKWTSIDLIVSGALGTLALIIFGAMGDGRDFMPDWEHNYLSWSFGLGFLGVLFEYIAGILFFVEARIITRKEAAREKQLHPMEREV